MAFEQATSLLLTSLAVLAWPQVAPAQAPSTAGGVMAVMPFENGGSFGKDRKDFEALSRGIAGAIGDGLHRQFGSTVVDRGIVQKLVSADSAAAKPRLDAAAAAKIGRDAGASIAVYGTFIDYYGKFRIDCRVIDASSGRILAVVSSGASLQPRDELAQLLADLAKRIGTAVGLAEAAGPSPMGRADAQTVLLYSQALLAEDRGNTEEAASLLRKALARAPGYPPAEAELGRLGR